MFLRGRWSCCMGNGLAWVTDRNRETSEEAVAITQVRGDGDLSEGGSREWGRCKKWLDSGAILKIEPL